MQPKYIMMDKKLRDLLVMDGVQQCQHILDEDNKDVGEMYPDGKVFFRGCVEGFELSKRLVCLEQFEQFIIHFKNTEAQYKSEEKMKKSKTSIQYNDFIKSLGKRCALEFIYNTIGGAGGTSHSSPFPLQSE